jgi:hypothetical protein
MVNDEDKTDAQRAFDSALASKTNPQQAFDDALSAKQNLPSSDITASAPRVVNTDIPGPSVPTYDDDDEDDSTTLLDSTTRETTYDDRLEVPATWVPLMGWEPGDAIYAILDGNKIVMKCSVVSGEEVLGTMFVNRDGRLRLTKMASIGAGWPTGYGQRRWVKRYSDRIEISRTAGTPSPPIPTSVFVF